MEFSNDEKTQQLLSYFEENYIFGKMKMLYRNNKAPKRHEPIFLPEMWSVSSRILVGIPRTSNSAKGWHNKIHQLLTHHLFYHTLVFIMIVTTYYRKVIKHLV